MTNGKWERNSRLFLSSSPLAPWRFTWYPSILRLYPPYPILTAYTLALHMSLPRGGEREAITDPCSQSSTDPVRW